MYTRIRCRSIVISQRVRNLDCYAKRLADSIPDVLRLALEATPTWPEVEPFAVTA